MTEALTVTASVLPPECGRELMVATLAAVRQLGGEAMFLDEDDDFAPGVVRLARIALWLVLCERPGDRATGKPRRITAYQVAETEPGVPFKLDPEAALFVLHEQGFYRPPDWSLTLLHDPREWFNLMMQALWTVLEPVLPAA